MHINWKELIKIGFIAGRDIMLAYTNIDPGTYTFKVKGTNNDGVWNEEGTYITIIINPPWWRTWWAYTIYGLLLIAAAFCNISVSKATDHPKGKRKNTNERTCTGKRN